MAFRTHFQGQNVSVIGHVKLENVHNSSQIHSRIKSRKALVFKTGVKYLQGGEWLPVENIHPSNIPCFRNSNDKPMHWIRIFRLKYC